jgi:DNA-binding response OmpR family regulator
MGDGRILVVEDELIARRVLHDMLERVGHEVTAVSSGEEAIEQLQSGRFDLVLTDLQLRKVDGLAVVASARERDPDIEAIVLTGYATLDSAIAAVRQGATNYILKPGQPGEIETSVSAALARRATRRHQAASLRRLGESLIQLAGNQVDAVDILPTQASPSPAHILTIGQLVIDQHRHSATLAGRNLLLSPGEFSLLIYMAQHHQQVLSPQQIVRDVLGYQVDQHEARDLIKARVWALRRKVERDPAEPEYVVSVRGVGYMLNVQ